MRKLIDEAVDDCDLFEGNVGKLKYLEDMLNQAEELHFSPLELKRPYDTKNKLQSYIDEVR